MPRTKWVGIYKNIIGEYANLNMNYLEWEESGDTSGNLVRSIQVFQWREHTFMSSIVYSV